MNVRVLLVDDERTLVKLLRGYLEREGFEVHEALDGNAALEVARRVHPDVVILDWMLPGLDGMEVLRELRRFSEAYVIMLTARTEEVDRIVGLSIGADDYLVKPFSPGELVARVRAMLRRPRGKTGEQPGTSRLRASVNRSWSARRSALPVVVTPAFPNEAPHDDHHLSVAPCHAFATPHC